jgi:putative hydrolase of the HAD superfamily
MTAAPAREFLRGTIARLAARYDAPIFEPHLTLAIGPDSATEAHRILTGITAGPIELRTAGVHFEATFTKALFIRFDSSPDLVRLRNSLGTERRDDQSFDPHVSLLYKMITAEEQAQLAAAVRLPFETVRFDAVKIVRCRLPVTTSAAVTSWEVVAWRRLKD